MPRKTGFDTREMQSEERDDDPRDLPPSKTKRKKAMHELQSLGEELVALNATQLASVPMPEDLRDAVQEAMRIKSHEGRRRQMQYIGRLMRDVDAGPIRERLAAWNGQSRAHAAHEREIARWRDRLIDEEASIAEFATEYPAADVQHLRQLARNARADRDASRPPKNYRELFRALRDAIPERSMNAAGQADKQAGRDDE
jgi:ribosome-associated protein